MLSSIVLHLLLLAYIALVVKSIDSSSVESVWWQDASNVSVSIGAVVCVIEAREELPWALSGPIKCFAEDRFKRTGLLNPPHGNFVQISCGIKHCCAIEENAQVKCWGDKRAYTHLLPSDQMMIQVSVGDSLSCGVQLDGGLICWGPLASKSRPENPEIPSGHFVQTVVCGKHACALRQDRSLHCWGSQHNCKSGSCTDQLPDEFRDLKFNSVSCSPRLTCGIVYVLIINLN